MIRPTCRKCKAVIVEPPDSAETADLIFKLSAVLFGSATHLRRDTLSTLLRRHKILTEMVKHRYCKACVRQETDWTKELLQRTET